MATHKSQVNAGRGCIKLLTLRARRPRLSPAGHQKLLLTGRKQINNKLQNNWPSLPPNKSQGAGKKITKNCNAVNKDTVITFLMSWTGAVAQLTVDKF